MGRSRFEPPPPGEHAPPPGVDAAASGSVPESVRHLVRCLELLLAAEPNVKVLDVKDRALLVRNAAGERLMVGVQLCS